MSGKLNPLRGEGEGAPSTMCAELAECVSGGENLPIDITRRTVVIHPRRRNNISRGHGCWVIGDDVKCARVHYDVVKNCVT